MHRFLASISAAFMLLSVATAGAQIKSGNGPDQTAFVDTVGSVMRYDAMIEMPKGYVSGVCIIKNCGDKYQACLFNEFGVSALDFSYTPGQKKVKIGNIIKMMDKWYIKRVVSSDLKHVLDNLLAGYSTYTNTKHKINYTFKLMNDAVEE